MGPGGAMVTMSYLGAVRSVPNYNVMGVAKAALEAATVTWPTTSGGKGSASTPSRQGRSGRWLPPAWAISAG